MGRCKCRESLMHALLLALHQLESRGNKQTECRSVHTALEVQSNGAQSRKEYCKEYRKTTTSRSSSRSSDFIIPLSTLNVWRCGSSQAPVNGWFVFRELWRGFWRIVDPCASPQPIFGSQYSDIPPFWLVEYALRIEEWDHTTMEGS